MEANRQVQDKKKNRYNKNLKFIVHPESRYSDEASGIFGMMFLLVVIWQFFLRMATNTPEMGWLLGGSLGFIIMFIYYKLIKMPRVLKGYDEAFFKRTYNNANIRFFKLDGFASVAMGIIAGNIIYFIHRYSVEKTFGTIWKLVINFNPIGIVGGAFIVWFIYYLDYGQDKYVSVREYSNLYNHFRKNGSEYESECHQRVLQKKDKDNNIHEYEGTYFDEKEAQELFSEEDEENNSIKRKKRY